MTATTLPADAVTVTVRAEDPLSRIGAVHLIGSAPGIRLVPPEDPPPREGAVVDVVVAERVDDTTTRELRRWARQPGHEVVLVCEPLREPELMVVLECGVRTILQRDEASREGLVAAVRSAARRESRVPSDLLGRLLVQVGRTHRASAHEYAEGPPSIGLVPREIDVLRLLAEGLETREVAAKLAYSERTIKNVVYALTTRLQLRNRTHAVAYAFREGYL